MNKLLEFGRKAWFTVRLLSGYEERRIRSYRLQLQKQFEQAQLKKAELQRAPEQAILKEVRQMVEQMQAVNRQLEETESAIEEYFKPIDKNVETIMKLQLEKEEKQMKEMMKVMQDQAMLQRATAEKIADAGSLNPHHQVPSTSSGQQQDK